MKSRFHLIALTLIIGVICIYNLSFTWCAKKFRHEAETSATSTNGAIDITRKTRYIDSLWNRQVYMGHTLEQVMNRELGLGLDLQGGIQVTLEVMPADVITALAAAHASEPAFRRALRTASDKSAHSTRAFESLFADAYTESGSRLAPLFTSSANRAEINGNASNAEVVPYLGKQIDQAVEGAFRIVRARIDRFGVSNPNIQRLPNTNRILVEIPGVDNPERVRKLLSGAAKLEFAEVYSLEELTPSLQKLEGYLANLGAPAQTDSSRKEHAGANGLEKALGANSRKELADSTKISRQLIRASVSGMIVSTTDTARVNRLLGTGLVREMFPQDANFRWGLEGEGSETILYAIRQQRVPASLTGSVITDAVADYDDSGRPAVTMHMNGEGARRWRQMTAANIGRQIAIMLDGRVYTAPVVNGEIPNGISSITGSFSADETKDLANVLKAGKLPAPLHIAEEVVVGSTLGSEAINAGLWSCAIGLILVLCFMALYYSGAGWIANATLLINLFFLLGIMASMGSVLTLAGIAGIVLTIGMSVDANVLIYEGIKAELDEGKPVVQAIKDGYKTSLTAILDSNITGLLTGGILFSFGSGLILGFATTLIIGLLTSLFTALFITRIIIERRAQRAGKIRFSSALTQSWFKGASFDFLSQRKRFYRIAVLVFIIGIGSFAFKGFDLGIDFKGGRSYVARFDNNIQTQAVRDKLKAALGNASVEVKMYGGFNQVKITTDYLMDGNAIEADKKAEQAVARAVSKIGTNHGSVQSSSKIGPAIAYDTMVNAVWAIVLALAVNFIYIVMRFKKVAFGVGAVAALLHDVFVLLAIYSLFNGLLPFALDIDQAFIGSLLTMIGYSMNDKIVIFDRIRSYLHDSSSKKDSIASIINNALNKTLNRTAVTGLTTMLVLVVLLIFGGETLRSFTFAMLVGVIVGTYSSLFIASPIVVDALQRKADMTDPVSPPVYARRVSISGKI